MIRPEQTFATMMSSFRVVVTTLLLVMQSTEAFVVSTMKSQRSATPVGVAVRETTERVSSPRIPQKNKKNAEFPPLEPLADYLRVKTTLPVGVEDGRLEVLGTTVLGAAERGSSKAFGAMTRSYDLESVTTVEKGAFLSFKVPREEARFDVKLGSLDLDRSKTLSLSQLKRWWSAPSFDGEIPLETQYLFVERDDGMYVMFLPLLSDDGRFRCTLWNSKRTDPPWFASSRSNTVELRARVESGDGNWKSSETNGMIWVGGMYANDAATAAYTLLNRGLAASAKRKRNSFRPLTQKTLPTGKILDGLGWCTWDACYSAVDASQIDDGLRRLKETTGLTVQRLIVDDGWAQLDREPPVVTTTHDGGKPLMTGESLRALDVADNVATQLYTMESSSTTDLAAATPTPAPTTLTLKYIGLRLQQSIASFIGDLYAKYVEAGQDNSPAVVIWRFFARRQPLRSALISFFDENTDFTRRLVWPPRAHAKKFGGTQGFKEFISYCRSHHGVQFVTVWHAIAGHWGGVTTLDDKEKFEPGNIESVSSKASPHLRFVEPSIAWDPASLKGMTTPTTAKGINTLYDGLYKVLKACGVDGIKADAPSGVGPLGHQKGGGPAAVNLFVTAMERAAEKYFGDDSKGGLLPVTNCMCHSTENLYSYASTSIARASDDFYPRDPDSWLYHITACAYNSVFMGGLVWPDYDMFQSKHPAAWTHAAARAVSGSPVTVSDEPGVHDDQVLRSLALPSGDTFVAKAPGRVASDCLFSDVSSDGETALKIVAPSNNIGSAVAGVFNLQGSAWSRTQRKYVTTSATKKIHATIRPSDLLPALEHELLGVNAEAATSVRAISKRRSSKRTSSPFIAYSFSGGPLAKKHHVPVIDFRDTDLFHFDLEKPGDFRVFAVARLRTNDKTSFAPIGLIDMLNGGGAVDRLEEFDDSCVLHVQGPGRFAIFADDEPIALTDGGTGDKKQFLYDKQTKLLTVLLKEEGSHSLTFTW